MIKLILSNERISNPEIIVQPKLIIGDGNTLSMNENTIIDKNTNVIEFVINLNNQAIEDKIMKAEFIINLISIDLLNGKKKFLELNNYQFPLSLSSNEFHQLIFSIKSDDYELPSIFSILKNNKNKYFYFLLYYYIENNEQIILETKKFRFDNNELNKPVLKFDYIPPHKPSDEPSKYKILLGVLGLVILLIFIYFIICYFKNK